MAGAPVQQAAVQRRAAVRVHAELAMISEQWGGSNASRLCHPQQFVHVVVKVCSCSPKDNNYVINLPTLVTEQPPQVACAANRARAPAWHAAHPQHLLPR